MTPVGFEPAQFALVELESAPPHHSGKASTAGIAKFVVLTSGTEFSFKSTRGSPSYVTNLRFTTVLSVRSARSDERVVKSKGALPAPWREKDRF